MSEMAVELLKRLQRRPNGTLVQSSLIRLLASDEEAKYDLNAVTPAIRELEGVGLITVNSVKLDMKRDKNGELYDNCGSYQIELKLTPKFYEIRKKRKEGN